MKPKHILILFLPVLLLACATPVKHSTMSGKPEVAIKTSLKVAKREITEFMINRNYRVVRSDDMTIVFDKIINDGGMANFAFGSKYDMNPAARITYTFIENAKTVRVVADMAVITNPGSGLERRNDMNGHADSIYIQNELYRIKREIER